MTKNKDNYNIIPPLFSICNPFHPFGFCLRSNSYFPGFFLLILARQFNTGCPNKFCIGMIRKCAIISAKNWDNEAKVTYFLNALDFKDEFFACSKKKGIYFEGTNTFLDESLVALCFVPFLRNKTRNLLGSMDKPSCKKNKASRVVCNNVLSLSRVSYRYTRVRAVLDNARKFSSLGKLF